MKPAAIYLATDHAGFDMKNEIKSWLEAEGHQVTDCGSFSYDAEDDFPDFIQAAATQVSKAPAEHKAIIFGGSGQGEAMQANRFKGVRAVVYYGGDQNIVKLSREHNDANVLSIAARFVDVETAKTMIALWLATPALSDPKYHRRNTKLDRLLINDAKPE